VNAMETRNLPKETVMALNQLLLGQTAWVKVEHGGTVLQVAMFCIGWTMIDTKKIHLHIRPVHGLGETWATPSEFLQSQPSRPVRDDLAKILGWETNVTG